MQEEIDEQNAEVYTHELYLKTTFRDEKILNERFVVAHKIYNMLVAEGYRRLNLIYNNEKYLELTEKIKNLSDEERKSKHPLKTERAKLKFVLAKEVGLSGSSSMVFSQFITDEINKNLAWAGIHTLGTWVVRKLGERVAKPFLEFIKLNAQLNKFSTGKPKFLSKRNGKELRSVEGCYPDSAIVLKSKNNNYYIEWSNGQSKNDKVILSLLVFVQRKGKDYSELQAFADVFNEVPQKDKKGNIKFDADGNVETKGGLCYTRIVRKMVGGKWKYFAQLVLKGKPYSNVKTQNDKKVAIDLGPSQYGIISESSYKEIRPQRENSLGRASFEVSKDVSGDYNKFCGDLIAKDKEIALLQKELSRSDRINNPHVYDENGKTIKGKRIIHTKSYKKKLKKVQELHRIQSENIKIAHNKAIKDIIRRGNIVYMEKLEIKTWQKLWGKRIGFTSPGIFTAKLAIAVKRHGGHLENIETRKTKLSQLCHVCEKYTNKDTLTKSKKKGSGLSIRRQTCCGRNYQRDKYSAYLALHTKDNVVDIVKARENEKKYEKVLK